MVEINLIADETDDIAFVGLAQRIVNGAIRTHQLAEVRIFKIDNSFDHKWLAFSGKILGAFGHWNKHLTIPPFVANRLIGQWHYERDEQLTGLGPNIHHRGRAVDNRNRFVELIAPQAALFWFSSNTAETGRGSLMGYIPVENEDHWSWYLAFDRTGDWRIARRKSIHEYEVRLFQTAGEQLLGPIVDGLSTRGSGAV